MDNRLETIETAVHELVALSREQSKVNSNLERAIELLQASNKESRNHFDSLSQTCVECRKEISILQESRNVLKGGWLALTIIGACIVGLAGVVGALVAVLSMRH